MQRLSISRKIAILSLTGFIFGAHSVYSQLSLRTDQPPPSPTSAVASPSAAAAAAPIPMPPLPSSSSVPNPAPPPPRQQRPASDEMIPLNGVAAVVNEDVITMDEVKELTNSQEQTLAAEYATQQDVLRQKVGELRTEAVKELIDRQLILQEFKKMEAKGATIPDYIVDDHVQTYIRGQFNGDRAAFIRTLDAQGMTLAKFKEMEKDKIIVSAMREHEVKKDTFISPHDVEEYYHQHIGEFTTPDSVHLRTISLKKGGASDATQKALADEIRHKVQTGADFAKMAHFYSDSQQDNGGDCGWITPTSYLNPELDKVAFSLKPGTVSNVVDSSGCYWLLFVEAKKPGGSAAYTQVKGDIEKKLLQIEQQQQQEKWLAGLRAKAYIRTF